MEPAKLDTQAEYPHEEGLDVHPMLSLLIARMGSHPEEFYAYDPKSSHKMTGRPPTNNNKMLTVFNLYINQTKSLWNRKEKRLYNAALRNVRMQEAHGALMSVILSE